MKKACLVMILLGFSIITVLQSCHDSEQDNEFNNTSRIEISLQPETAPIPSMIVALCIIYKDNDIYADDGTLVYITDEQGMFQNMQCETYAGTVCVVLSSDVPGTTRLIVRVPDLNLETLSNPLTFYRERCASVGTGTWLFFFTFPDETNSEQVQSQQRDCWLEFSSSSELYSGWLDDTTWHALCERSQDKSISWQITAEFSGQSINVLTGVINVYDHGEFIKYGYLDGIRVGN